MSVSIIVDGFYGSCGKGKMTVHLARKQGCQLAIRTGGPNAGHVVYPNGHRYTTRQLPSALAVPGVPLAIGAGGMVDINLLNSEIQTLSELEVDIESRLFIDPFAAIVEQDAGAAEKGIGMNNAIGSTQTGTGITQSRRIMRTGRVAKDAPELAPFLGDVAAMANRIADEAGHVIIEGTQGFGLSLYHGLCYPFCTSRDTSASGFASEVGISPRLVTDIWLILRTFPIRVAGNSGPMKEEVDWDYVRRWSGNPEPFNEMTSVTKRVRRVSLFDWDLLARAIMVNRPTRLAVHGMDYIDYADRGKRDLCALSEKTRSFLLELSVKAGVPIGAVFTAPEQEAIVDLDSLRDQMGGGIPMRDFMSKGAVNL